MNPFLKKEWSNTEIPERVYREAREQAWARLHAPPGRAGRRLAWAMATAGLAAGAAFLIFHWNDSIVQPGAPIPQVTTSLVKPPIEPSAGGRAATTAATTRSLAKGTAARQPARRLDRRLPAMRPSEVPDRLVLNFVLPETGVRMIWIMDKEFQFNGEIE